MVTFNKDGVVVHLEGADHEYVTDLCRSLLYYVVSANEGQQPVSQTDRDNVLRLVRELVPNPCPPQAGR
jgi:hypothetical protein